MISKNVLVTGGSGSVGEFVVGLLLEKGYNVTAVDRQAPKYSFSENKNLRVVIGDITHTNLIKEVMQGINAVINTAAIVDITAPYQAIKGINLDAVKILYNEAKTAGVDFFLHFSTGSVYKQSTKTHNEESPVELLNAYIQTKYISEEFLLAKTDEKPVINIIRPALIYGPRIKVLAATMAMLPPIIKQITPVLPKISGGVRSNWVHAEDVARAVVFLFENPQKHGEIFNVADDEPFTIGEMFSIACKCYGIKLVGNLPVSTKRLVEFITPVKEYVLNFTNNFLKSEWKKICSKKFNLKSPLTPEFSSEALDFARQDTIFDNSKLKKLGFNYKYPSFLLGWPTAVEWYINNGWIPPNGTKKNQNFEINFSENMYGNYSLPEKGEKLGQFNFSCNVRIPSLESFLYDYTTFIDGEVTMENITDSTEIKGTLIIDPLIGKKLVYNFEFTGSDGQKYSFSGKKNVNFVNFLHSMTNLNGFIFKNDTLFAKANLRYNLQELPILISSMKKEKTA